MVAPPAGTRLQAVVPDDATGVRLDRFVATMPGIGTRSRAKQLLDGDHVRVNGVARKSAYTVHGGERIEVVTPPPEPTDVLPEDIPLVVLYEDEHLLAIDKPPGMVVHPGPGARRGTVANAVVHRLGGHVAGAAERPGIVHRLDRDTSGVLLIARTAAALEGLARQFRQRSLSKRYVAVVVGRVAQAQGRIDLPIGRHPRERKRMHVARRTGRAAVTRWAVAERFAGATLLRLMPETGRTHQLRVHLAALGHPIVADRVYGGQPRRGLRLPPAVDAALRACPRQALHAESLRFAHPVHGTELEVTAPLPDDLRQLLAALRQASKSA